MLLAMSHCYSTYPMPSCRAAALQRRLSVGDTDRRTLMKRLPVSKIPTRMTAASPKEEHAGNATARLFSTDGLDNSLQVYVSFLNENLENFGKAKFERAGDCGLLDCAGDNTPAQVIQGSIPFPDGAVPDIIAFEMVKGRNSKTDMVYITRIELSVCNGIQWIIPSNTWVHTGQRTRYLFGTTEAYLPGKEPPHLRWIRQQDLNTIRGSELQTHGFGQERKSGDRVYQYAPYNDLGDAYKWPPAPRPILGNSGGWLNYPYPYPRRIRTGRNHRIRPEPLGDTKGKLNEWKTLEQYYEDRTVVDGGFWVPLDDAFSTAKKQDFDAYTLMGVVALATTLVNAMLRDLKKKEYGINFTTHAEASTTMTAHTAGGKASNDKPFLPTFADMDQLYDTICANDDTTSEKVNSEVKSAATSADAKANLPTPTAETQAASTTFALNPTSVFLAIQEQQPKPEKEEKGQDVTKTYVTSSSTGPATKQQGPLSGLTSLLSQIARLPASLASLVPRLLPVFVRFALWLAPALARLPFPFVKNFGERLQRIKQLAEDFRTLFTFPRPVVWDSRRRAWMRDEEFGRQALAGVNPCVITAVRNPSQLGAIWRFRREVEAHTESNRLEELLARAGQDPRLLVIDHTKVFEDYAPAICQLEGSYGYSGRALLYRRANGDWVPVAIELKDGGLSSTDAGHITVYTPSLLTGTPNNTTPSKPTSPSKGAAPTPNTNGNDTTPKSSASNAPPSQAVQHVEAKPYMWLLVRGVLVTLDSAHHQLITHWLRTHAATEPYIIATRRQLSCLHPVHKLLMPHFAYTMRINSNARGTLISEGGVVESVFTPKEYSMRMSAAVYGALWEFDAQSLPKDLAARGLATLTGKKGRKVGKLLLQDYPYAEDGLLLWEAIEKWVGSYLQLYYSQNVTGDSELMAWWKEIQAEGHPDKKTGWPQLKDLDDLIYILTTMIWTASCHHAAINFSQYGYAGFALNRPVCTYTRLPRKHEPKYEAVQGKNAPLELHLDDDKPGNHVLPAERVYLETFCANLEDTLLVIFTLELLSSHSVTETYINDSHHPTFLDRKADKLHKAFQKELGDIKGLIAERNRDKGRRMRQDPSSEEYKALPYTFLIPDSVKVSKDGSKQHKYGVSNMGVPQSIST